ncbi:MAG: hypothetical protein M9899_07330 [Bdellovibrionaceae bacterium]|nr:hypothetical protein [Pseudobdellovibrionaceae bacterium]
MGTIKVCLLSLLMMMPISSWACDNQGSLIEGFLQRNKHWVEVENQHSTNIAKRNPILIDINFRNPEKSKILTFKNQNDLLGAIKSRDYSAGEEQLSSINSICLKNNVLEIKSNQGDAKLFYTGKVLNAEVRYGIFGSTFYFKKH